MWFLVLLVTLRQTGVASTSQDSIRLVDGSYSSEGRLEIYHNGKWGTVCDDGFNCADAMVACRQLGYSIGVSLGNSVSHGLSTIWLDGVQCSGSESTIAECRHNAWGVHDCHHYEDVGVRCFRLKESCVPTSGGWSPWSEWSTCTITCGGGLQRRSRDCNNPRPGYGANYCVGASVANQVCNH
ncbi:galectin-3-binding protein A-like [Mytilus galloprovincialis]|uniref:galectin-3-binding protein A-like n=1 Tax=Mytilus galloprovincialis TaxID=29158 RepID=UPI003F7BB7A1